MTLLATIIALLIEQARPLPGGNLVHAAYGRYAAWVESRFNAGTGRHGMIAWFVAIVPIVLVAVVAGWFVHRGGVLVELGWNAAVVYLTMGFRQFSHSYSGIAEALKADDAGRARELLAHWRGRSGGELSPTEIATVAIEQGLVASHRHVFGVLAWFVVLGPAGALAYRCAALLRDTWSVRPVEEAGEFPAFACRAFAWMDWLPARLTAAGFAVVGDFEDAVYCWRSQAAAWIDQAHALILAAGAGALGVKLGGALHEAGTLVFRPELGIGDAADADFMLSAIGLLWRTLVLWLALMFLVHVARWVG